MRRRGLAHYHSEPEAVKSKLATPLVPLGKLAHGSVPGRLVTLPIPSSAVGPELVLVRKRGPGSPLADQSAGSSVLSPCLLY